MTVGKGVESIADPANFFKLVNDDQLEFRFPLCSGSSVVAQGQHCHVVRLAGIALERPYVIHGFRDSVFGIAIGAMVQYVLEPGL